MYIVFFWVEYKIFSGREFMKKVLLSFILVVNFSFADLEGVRGVAALAGLVVGLAKEMKKTKIIAQNKKHQQTLIYHHRLRQLQQARIKMKRQK